MKYFLVKKSGTTATVFAVIALLQSNTACLSDAKPRVANPSSTSLNLAEVPSLSRVDGSQLTVSDITIAQWVNPKLLGATEPLVDFRYSPASDYIEAQLCDAETRECKEVKNLIENKSVLPSASDGATVFLKLRACVQPERSTSSKNCGGWVEKQYTQWVTSDPTKKRLMDEKEQVEQAIKDYAKSLEDLAKLVSDRAAKCQPASEGAKQLIDAERGFAEAIAKLGGSIIKAVADKAASRPAAPATKTADSGAGGDGKKSGESGAGSGEVKTEGPILIALTADTPTSELQLSSQSGGDLIVPQDPKYYATIVRVIGNSIAQRARALRTLSNASSFTGGGALNAASSNPADHLGNPPATGDAKPPAGSDPAKVEGSTKKDENLGKELGKGGTPTGTKLDLAPLINVLPDIAGAMFDLGNAERIVAATVGVCVQGFDQKQEQALSLARAAAEAQKKILETRVESLSAKIKAGG